MNCMSWACIIRTLDFLHLVNLTAHEWLHIDAEFLSYIKKDTICDRVCFKLRISFSLMKSPSVSKYLSLLTLCESMIVVTVITHMIVGHVRVLRSTSCFWSSRCHIRRWILICEIGIWCPTIWGAWVWSSWSTSNHLGLAWCSTPKILRATWCSTPKILRTTWCSNIAITGLDSYIWTSWSASVIWLATITSRSESSPTSEWIHIFLDSTTTRLFFLFFNNWW